MECCFSTVELILPYLLLPPVLLPLPLCPPPIVPCPLALCSSTNYNMRSRAPQLLTAFCWICATPA